MRAAWQLHARLVRRSLERGFYQGWDLHPAQLATRYAATPRSSATGGTPRDRLRHCTGQRTGCVLDEPATARALAAFLLRGLDCGAVTPDEALAVTGLDRDQLTAVARRQPADGRPPG